MILNKLAKIPVLFALIFILDNLSCQRSTTMVPEITCSPKQKMQAGKCVDKAIDSTKETDSATIPSQDAVQGDVNAGPNVTMRLTPKNGQFFASVKFDDNSKASNIQFSYSGSVNFQQQANGAEMLASNIELPLTITFTYNEKNCGAQGTATAQGNIVSSICK